MPGPTKPNYYPNTAPMSERSRRLMAQHRKKLAGNGRRNWEDEYGDIEGEIGRTQDLMFEQMARRPMSPREEYDYNRKSGAYDSYLGGLGQRRDFITDAMNRGGSQIPPDIQEMLDEMMRLETERDLWDVRGNKPTDEDRIADAQNQLTLAQLEEQLRDQNGGPGWDERTQDAQGRLTYEQVMEQLRNWLANHGRP